MANKKFYDILGVPCFATEAEIRKAFRVRALAVHPDKRPGDSEAAKNFHELRKAFEVLCDPVKRKNYDRTGEEEYESHEFDSAFHFFSEKLVKVTEAAISVRTKRGCLLLTIDDYREIVNDSPNWKAERRWRWKSRP
jgi:DnaJ-class molecular chaperone